MKKFLLTLVCVLLAVAANAEVANFDFTTSPAHGITADNNKSIANNSTVKVEPVTITFNVASTGNGCRLYGTNPYTLRIYNSSGITLSVADAKITKIELTGSTLTALTVSDNNGTYSSGTWTGESESVQLKNTVKTSAGKNQTVQIKTIKVTYTPNQTDPRGEAGLSFPEKSYTVKVGQTFTKPELTNPNNLTVSYSSSNTDVATVDATTGDVTVVAEGTTVIKASTEGNTEFKPGEASYTLTVVGKTPAGITYGEVNEVSVLTTEIASFVSPVLTNPNNLAVTYASDNAAVASVAKDGTISLTGTAGKAIITATTAETEEYAAGEAIYTINVMDPAAIPASLTVSFNFNNANSDDFISKLNTAYTAPSSQGVVLDKVISNQDITIAYALGTANKGTDPKWWKATKGLECRFYAGNTLTITAPEGYIVKGFTFTQGVSTDKATSFTVKADGSNVGTFDSKTLTWTAGDAECNSVIFTGKIYYTILDVTVEKIATAPVAPEAPVASTEEGVVNGDVDLSNYTNGVEITLTVAEGCSLYYKFDAIDAPQSLIDAEAEGYTKAEGTTIVLPVDKAGTLSYFAEKDGQQSAVQTISFKGATTAISEIEAAEGEAIYYDLMGRKVANPEKGLYIRVINGKAVKVVL